jgi:hypothetical protein
MRFGDDAQQKVFGDGVDGAFKLGVGDKRRLGLGLPQRQGDPQAHPQEPSENPETHR